MLQHCQAFLPAVLATARTYALSGISPCSTGRFSDLRTVRHFSPQYWPLLRPRDYSASANNGTCLQCCRRRWIRRTGDLRAFGQNLKTRGEFNSGSPSHGADLPASIDDDDGAYNSLLQLIYARAWIIVSKCYIGIGYYIQVIQVGLSFSSAI